MVTSCHKVEPKIEREVVPINKIKKEPKGSFFNVIKGKIEKRKREKKEKIMK